MSFTRAIATVGGLTMLSRIAGFLRDVLTAAIVGAGPVSDAFFVALRLPNFFRLLFGEGAFSVSFVPLFGRTLEQDGKPAARAFAEQAMAMMILALLPFTVLALVVMPWIMALLAPGFVGDAQRYELAVEMARITFPYLLLVSLVALMGGLLNSVHRFAPFAAAPIAFNLVIMASMLLLTPHVETAGHAMAYGVTASGVVQLAWLAWSCRRAGVTLRLVRPRLSPRIRRLFRLMTPGIVGAGVSQINLFVDLVLASLLPVGGVSYLYYASHLNQLPLGVIGIAVGTALLPLLSRLLAAGQEEAARHTFSRAIEISLLLALPAAVALIVVPQPIIATLFQRGAFNAEDARQTGLALAAYSLSIPAYVVSKVLSAGYFAREDTAGPVKVGIVVTLANASLAWLLIAPLAHVGIALATGVTAWLQTGLLAIGLARRGHLHVDARLKRRAPRILLAAALMAGVLFALAVALEDWFAGPGTLRAAALALLVAGGGAIYGGLVLITGAAKLSELRQSLSRATPPAGKADQTDLDKGLNS